MERRQRSQESGNRGMFRLAPLLLFALLAVLLFSDMVFAANIGDGLRNVGGRISGFFNDYASSEGPSFLDFFIFAIIFFTMCWVGFSAVFKEAKAANIALSIALGLALSLALVYGGKFTIKKLLPFAAIFLFLLLMIAIYALLKKFVFTKDTTASKIFSALFAIIISIAILAVAWHFICEDNRCESNAFLSKIFGSESIIGKWFGDVGDWFDDIGDTAGAGTDEPLIPGEGPLLPNCGNGVVDVNEICDTGGEDKPDTCAPDGQCNNCVECVPLSSLDVAKKEVSRWWVYALIILVLGILLTFLIVKRKSLNEKLANWRRRRGKKRELAILAKLLEDTDRHDKDILTGFKELCKKVNEEQEKFQVTRHVVDEITTDIKETIGGEKEFISTRDPQTKQNIIDRIDALQALNTHERNIINNDILPKVRDQMNVIAAGVGTIGQELKDRIDALDELDKHFEDHEKILRSLSDLNFSEKGVLTSLENKLNSNLKSFQTFAQKCDEMLAFLNTTRTDLDEIVHRQNIDYPTIINHVKQVRENAIKMNRIFMWKVDMLRYLVQRMKDVKVSVEELHQKERAALALYLKNAADAKNAGNLDTAVYLASHVLENAEYLMKTHLSDVDRNVLVTMINDARGLIQECLPRLFESMKERIEEQFDKRKFDEVAAIINNIGTIKFTLDRSNNEFKALKDAYEQKMKDLGVLCGKLKEADDVRKAIYTALGITPPV